MRTLKNPIGLAWAVVALLAGNIVFDVLLGLIDVRNLAADETDFYDPAAFGPINLNVAYSLSRLLYWATGIVFIIWFYRLRKNAEIWARDLQSRTPGWAIGSWFIPIANFWIPQVIAADIWRASRREPYAADGKRELALLNSWWACWNIGIVAEMIATMQYKFAETIEAWTTATWWSLAGDALDIPAAVLAILVVQRLTSMQHAKATGMIPAAQ
ncbi:DUF4328 domain-containing protein [Streptomyces sp. NPDC053792]|uniref:DUF4328 domain-containing protein n=1 Tax=unclassified Streptomyces TaxID=2593676 RepID=UPI00342DDCAC